jgi:hypothetical protein
MADRKNDKRVLDVRSTHITIQNMDSRWYQLFTYTPDGHLMTDKSLGADKEWYVHVYGKTDAEMR